MYTISNQYNIEFTARFSPKRDNLINIIRDHLNEGKSISEITKLVKKNTAYIKELIRTYNLRELSENENSIIVKQFKGFLEEKKSLKEICQICNKNGSWVRGIIEKYNINYPEEILSPNKLSAPKVLEPHVVQMVTNMINKQAPVSEISKQTGLTNEEIYEWIKNTYKYTPGRLYARMNRIKESYQSAELYDKSAATFNPDKYKILDEKAPYMIQDGFKASDICRILKVCRNTLQKWIQNRYNVQNINELRKQYGITVQNINQQNMLIEALSKFNSITESADYMKIGKIKIFALLKKYNLKSQIAQKRMKIEKELPILIKRGDTPKQIAEYFGVNTTTIYRRIRKLKTQNANSQ